MNLKKKRKLEKTREIKNNKNKNKKDLKQKINR